MPTTEAEWKKVKGGTLFEVLLKETERPTKMVLAGSQSVRIVPHPDDRWVLNLKGATNAPVGWQGDPTLPAATREQLQVRVYPDLLKQGKPVSDPDLAHGHGQPAAWTDLAALPDGVFTGPGEVLLRGAVDSDSRGLARGSIRVKIVLMPKDK
jgi:hypothetical protein